MDLFIGAFLKQEGLHKDKKEQYDGIVKTMEEMQKELTALRQDEQVHNFSSPLRGRSEESERTRATFDQLSSLNTTLPERTLPQSLSKILSYFRFSVFFLKETSPHW